MKAEIAKNSVIIDQRQGKKRSGAASKK